MVKLGMWICFERAFDIPWTHAMIIYSADNHMILEEMLQDIIACHKQLDSEDMLQSLLINPLYFGGIHVSGLVCCNQTWYDFTLWTISMIFLAFSLHLASFLLFKHKKTKLHSNSSSLPLSLTVCFICFRV